MQYKTMYRVDSGFVVGPHLAHGHGGLDASLRMILQEHQISTIIDLTCPSDGVTQPLDELSAALPNLEVHSFPIPDMGVPSQPLLLAILDAIDAARSQRRNIYLHCVAGIGRSGTIIACWYIRHGDTPSAALARLASIRGELHAHSPSPESAAQAAFVHAWVEPAQLLVTRFGGFRDRFRGALLGLAVGDCLGVPLEFTQPGERTVRAMEGGGPFGLTIGEWTDDTSMALCLAESLTEKSDFDALDQMQRYCRWWNSGHLSSTGRCFDIGTTTAAALRRFEHTGDPFAGSTEATAAGNGSLMRLAPIPVYYFGREDDAIARAAESSRTTHGAAVAIDACRYFAALITGALQGADKDALLSPRYSPTPGYWNAAPLHPAIAAIADGSFKAKEPPAIRAAGYVADSLEAALWAFHRSSDFREGCLLAANLGDDADTVAAIFGQIAGAYYGESGIPVAWRERLTKKPVLDYLAEQLCVRG